MREIRTRPKERERKHTYTLPKQAVKTLQQQALRRKMMKRELDKDAELRDTPVQETVQRFETSAEKAARLSSRTAFRVGKQAAKEQFDRRNAPSSRKENSQPGDSTAQPESPQKAQVRQEFQRTRQRGGRGSIFDRHRPKDVKHTRILRLPPLRSGRKHTGGPKWRTLLYSIHPARQCCLKSRYRKRDSYSPKRRRNLLHRLPSQLQRRNRKKSTKAGCF